MSGFTESIVEEADRAWLQNHDWSDPLEYPVHPCPSRKSHLTSTLVIWFPNSDNFRVASVQWDRTATALVRFLD